MADPQLPEDVLIEILIRLPVKSISKLRCVSKSWRDLIRSPIFLHRHQKRETKQSVLLVKRYMMPENGNDVVLSFHKPDFPELLMSPNLSIPVWRNLDIRPLPYGSLSPIYGPCNGLVCIPVGRKVWLCNPALREFKLLPPLNIPCPEGYEAAPFEFGFWFDPNTSSYSVIQISEICPINYEDSRGKPDYTAIDLYSSASKTWKKIDATVSMINQMRSFHIFFGGVFHWYELTLSYYGDGPYILCFDTSIEVFRRLDFPDGFTLFDGNPSLMVLNESLAMVQYSERWPSEIAIWVMKEYGVKESWTRQFVIGPHMINCPFLMNNEWLLVESNNGLSADNQLAVCGLEEKQFEKLPFYGFGSSFSAVVYEESLISLSDII